MQTESERLLKMSKRKKQLKKAAFTASKTGAIPHSVSVFVNMWLVGLFGFGKCDISLKTGIGEKLI